MDVSKILFDFLKNDKISSSFEDLDINGDGKINNADKSAAQNSALAAEIQELLNSVDPEPEIVDDAEDNSALTSFAQMSLTSLENELKTLSDEIEEKEEEYEALATKIEEKQEKYDEIAEKLEEAQEGDNTASLKSQAEALASEMRILGLNLTTLVSNINNLEMQYSNKSKLLETEQSVVNSISKAGSTGASEGTSATLSVEDTSETADASSLTSQTSDCSDDALYVDGKGFNIGKIADVVMDMYDKVKYDKNINQQYEAKYSRFSRNNYTRMAFAIYYLWTSGTDEQKKALKSIFPQGDLSDEKRITQRAGRLANLFKQRGSYSKENFVTRLSSKDKDKDGYLADTEADGAYYTEYHNFKYLTSDGTIKDAEFKDDPDNAYNAQIIYPENSLIKTSFFSLTKINGIETYNVRLQGANIGGSNIHISQSEAEKLTAYFDTAGDNATLEGALEAMSCGNVNKSSKTIGPKNGIGRTVTHTTYKFSSESGLSSEIQVGTNPNEEKMLAVLKALSLNLKCSDKDNFSAI